MLQRNPEVLDPLQNLGGRHWRVLLNLDGRFRWRWPPIRLWMLGSRARPTLGLAHAFQHAGGCDNPVWRHRWSPSVHPVPWAAVGAFIRYCDLAHILQADGCRWTLMHFWGRLQTEPAYVTASVGVCIERALAAQWLSEPSKSCRRYRAECPGHRQYQDRRSGVEPGTRAPPNGFDPGTFDRVEQFLTPAFWVSEASRVGSSRRIPRGQHPAAARMTCFTRRIQRCLGPPRPGRRLTMDTRQRRSLQPELDHRQGTTLRGTDMPGTDQLRGSQERTSSPSRRCTPVSGSADGRSTNGGRRTGCHGASRCRMAACASASPNISGGCPPSGSLKP